jgi:hypothetical protein
MDGDFARPSSQQHAQRKARHEFEWRAVYQAFRITQAKAPPELRTDNAQ